jgi:hypothetical protein
MDQAGELLLMFAQGERELAKQVAAMYRGRVSPRRPRPACGIDSDLDVCSPGACHRAQGTACCRRQLGKAFPAGSGPLGAIHIVEDEWGRGEIDFAHARFESPYQAV